MLRRRLLRWHQETQDIATMQVPIVGGADRSDWAVIAPRLRRARPRRLAPSSACRCDRRGREARDMTYTDKEAPFVGIVASDASVVVGTR